MTQQLSPINPALRASTVKKSPETLTDLPDEMLEAIFSFLSRSQLIGVALVNKRFKDITQSMVLKQAKGSGYKDTDFTKAVKYLDSFRILALKGPLSEYQVKDEKSEIDCVATFKRFQHEKKTNLKDELNKSLISLWENLSEDKNEVAVLIKALIMCGANPNTKNQLPAGSTEFYTVIDGMINNEFSEDSVLHYAIMNDYLDAVYLLLKMGANVNAENSLKQTPLHYAVHKGDEKTLTLLLKNNACIDERDIYGKTPLHYAVRKGSEDIIAFLIKNHAFIDKPDILGQTALHCAALRGNKEIAAFLIEKSATIDIKDNFGQTALHLAAREGKRDIVKLLVAMGAKVDLQDVDGNTPLDVARQEGHVEIVELLTPTS
ncbi:MAG: ankyrin repeat domain-containing protein [Chlamydiales bacterium]|nr:ankyrin repeat domain-containing protein [Chlamydiales bacterium]